MIPRRKPKQAKRTSRYRSQKHKIWLRGFECADTEVWCDGETQVAHVRIGSGAGMGEKPDDWRAVPLCKACHLDRQHVEGERTFWADYAKRHGQTVDQLIDDLCRASPCAREIREHRDA